MSKLSGYLRLMRPVNCLMMSIAVMVGVVLASSNFLEALLLDLIWGFVTGFMLTAASMAINDYYDKEIDAINEPNRPIPSGLINPREALAFAFILTAIGFAAAYLTNIFCFVIAIIAWIVFVTYTTVGKRSGLPGNFLVSACVATPFIYGSVVIANAVGLNVLIFASMAFLSNTGREITKGIVDVEGDEMQNVKTLAVRYGEKNAAIAATIFYLLAVLLSPIPRLLNIVSFWFIPLVAVTDFGLVASAFMLLRDYSRENARKVKSMVLLWFIFGLLAFIVGAVR
ncbi:MAG: geranylgeranylglycerol-phosphate geranylgeranyltransferase [Candidatus Bathyarchaeota archaeon]|nr:geranylgeranylglycerol-phosphate geranylgeranyltransferase [Candidatus Bathyarchaeota archaeon]MDH5746456.1 geranylgeranylglycerol-phosphate geranylgeranyltransferase [Candidatus Bathyarchaeota archaeon]